MAIQFCGYLVFLLIAFSFTNVAAKQTGDTTAGSIINQQIWIMDFEFRMRYKVTGKYDFHQRWFASFYGEYFLPVTGEIQELYRNKGRAGIELGYKAAKTWQFSFVFNWQGSRTGMGEKLNASDYAYQLKIKKVWRRLTH